MTALAALLPILAILVLMIGFGRTAVTAGAAGLGLAAILAVGVFGFGDTLYGGIGPGRAAMGVLAEAAFLSATILWIVFPALCLHQLQLITGAAETLQRWLVGLSGEPVVVILLVAWFFTLFMEGAAGFGTPVALAAPILVGLGLTPAKAVTLGLLGNAVGVSFGAVGTPVLPQIALTPFDALALSWPPALLHVCLGWGLALVLVRVAQEGPEPGSAPDSPALTALLAAACFLVPFGITAAFVGPELPTLAGALIGAAAFLLVLRGQGRAGGVERGSHDTAVLCAGLPYLLVLALILATRLIAPLKEALSAAAIEWDLFAVFSGQTAPLYHPGTMLFASFLLGGLAQGARAGDMAVAMKRAAARLVPVIFALLFMLSLARLMVHAEMVQALAAASAALFGGVWPLIAPFIGVLGSFVTGSATSSNILFTDFQEETAQRLGLNALMLVGAQNFGAAVGNMIAPHNIIAAGATVGLAGAEGGVLKRTILPCLGYAALGGLLLLLLL